MMRYPITYYSCTGTPHSLPFLSSRRESSSILVTVDEKAIPECSGSPNCSTASARWTAYSTFSSSSESFARSNRWLKPHCRTCDSSTFYFFTYFKFTSKFLDMPQLLSDDKKVVKRWWKCCYEQITKRGYYLERRYSPSTFPSNLPENCRRGFQDIVGTGAEITAKAKRKTDHCWYLLTLVPSTSDSSDDNGQDYLTVNNRGSHKLKVTPLSAHGFFHRILPSAWTRTRSTIRSSPCEHLMTCRTGPPINAGPLASVTHGLIWHKG
ncbi:hypothetical protein BJV78DRAFT_1206737 [Lactifluus subvellereus]|nr:hypothetical protein BJV78DRAFT_1206737 [Lactifluus subvellereus]